MSANNRGIIKNVQSRSVKIEGEKVGTTHYESTLYRRKSEKIHEAKRVIQGH